jgi:BON domain
MLNQGKASVTIVFLAGLLAAGGCSRKPDDTQIAQNIQAQLRNDTAIHGQVSVESRAGMVSLSGQVGTEAERKLAAQEAATTPGVREVINNLTVEPVAATPPPPATEESLAAPVAPERHSHEPRHSREMAPQAPPVETAAAPEPAVPSPAANPAPAAPPPPVPDESTPPLPPPPVPEQHTIPAGTTLSVRLIDSLDSSRNQVGDTFRATLYAPLRRDGEVVVPAGTDVEGRVVEVANAGRFSGHSELKLALTRLNLHGHVYALNTEDYSRTTAGRGKGTAETVGGGAALGAIIGAIAGGGRGAAIGTLAGAGAGGVARGARRAKAITFPSETVLSFRLQEPVTVTIMPRQ